MRKIELKDILNIADYELKRDEIRKRILKEKSERRISVGPNITFLFENFNTLLYQIQEIMRAERIVKKDAILREIKSYNELMPEDNQLSATMFLASGNVKQDLKFLQTMVTLPQHTFLAVGDKRIIPTFEKRQLAEDKISSVQYVKFNLDESMKRNLVKDDVPVMLGFNHPTYMYEYFLTEKDKYILYDDLVS
jgi:hypothetical protein